MTNQLSPSGGGQDTAPSSPKANTGAEKVQGQTDQVSLPPTSNESDIPQENWIWAIPNHPSWIRYSNRAQPFLAAWYRNNAFQFNVKSLKELGIKKGSRVAVAYNAESDCIGLRPNDPGEHGVVTGTKSMAIGSWLGANFGFRLLEKETYRIEKNEPGADPPYIIPLNGRRTPA